MTPMSIRDVSLAVEVEGNGPPLVLMHGGPGADQWTLLPLRRLADRFTLVFYDHRCNGRSTGAPVESMTWENLTADADALRERLGFDRWAVLGHSFGGNVALEYVLRYPARVSHLVLMDAGGDTWWPRENGPEILARRGFDPKLVALVRRFFHGRIRPDEMMRAMLRMGDAYHHRRGISLLWLMTRDLLAGEWRTKMRPEALIHAGRVLLDGWTVMDRLGEVTAPTLVMGGRDDFLYPPEHQAQVAAGIPGARLRIIERAGHNPHSEERERTMAEIRDFLLGTPAPASSPASTSRHRRRPAAVGASGGA